MYLYIFLCGVFVYLSDQIALNYVVCIYSILLFQVLVICHVFLCYPTCLLISRNYRCDAIIPVVKLFCWVALEPTTDAKCKPGQSQWVLLKLESCCDVIKPLFSTAIMAGQHSVPAQEVFLKENGCNTG